MIFDPEFHKYYHDDGVTEMPGVTAILERAGYIDTRFFDTESRDRGTAVHDFCERYARGERYDKLGRELRSLEYVNAFAAWIRDSGAYAVNLEGLVSNCINGKWYGGKFDGLYEVAGKIVLIDVKTGAKAKWHKMQLAAYAMAKLNPSALIDLYLRADGSYKTDALNSSEMIEGVRAFKDALEAY